MKKVSEVYEKYYVDNSIYVITLPHTNPRIWFDDKGDAETKKAWELEHKNYDNFSDGNDYNQYFYFFHLSPTMFCLIKFTVFTRHYILNVNSRFDIVYCLLK